MVINRFVDIVNRKTDAAPLAIFRIAFGVLMGISILRFMLKGWVFTLYIQPKFFFPFFGWDWLKPLPGNLMYGVFALLLLSAVFIALGLFYRLSIAIFFVVFTYVELIDKTNYLNHYYFISLIAFLMIFVPAGKICSLDNLLFKRKSIQFTANGFILLLQIQMFTLYFFAGIAKLNQDWLLNAQPLKIWLPPYNYLPLIGPYLEKEWVAFFASWFGCIYDLLIGFLLFNHRTVKWGYFLVVTFHLATAMFFNIGMFPWIMIVITTIFFPPAIHRTLLNFVSQTKSVIQHPFAESAKLSNSLLYFFIGFFVIQFSMPFRYLFYNGKLFWTEQGYRFSWRVMLMEKAGTALFTVEDTISHKKSMVFNNEHLTYMQEKMMSTQPDMLVDYAHYLKEVYLAKGYKNPIVKAEVYVTLNGSGSKPFINPEVNLAEEKNSMFESKTWVYSY